MFAQSSPNVLGSDRISGSLGSLVPLAMAVVVTAVWCSAQSTNGDTRPVRERASRGRLGAVWIGIQCQGLSDS